MSKMKEQTIKIIGTVMISSFMIVAVVYAATTIGAAITTTSTLNADGATTLGSHLTVDTNTLYVDATGNDVSIGTTTPNQKLGLFANGADVGIELSAASGDNYKWVLGMDYSDGASFVISSSTALGTTNRFKISGSGAVTIGGATSLSSSLAVTGLTSLGVATLSSTLDVTGKTTLGNASSTVFTNSGNAYLATTAAGNRVGVGTTTPNHKLELYSGTATSTLSIDNNQHGVTGKGSCVKMRTTNDGTYVYCYVNGTTFTCSATTCE